MTVDILGRLLSPRVRDSDCVRDRNLAHVNRPAVARKVGLRGHMSGSLHGVLFGVFSGVSLETKDLWSISLVSQRNIGSGQRTAGKATVFCRIAAYVHPPYRPTIHGIDGSSKEPTSAVDPGTRQPSRARTLERPFHWFHVLMVLLLG